MFFGPYGSGKSSLIGSLFRAVNCVDIFPEKVWQTLNHPDEDTHGTLRWLETWGNKKQTIAYQDTRGDQVVQFSVCTISSKSKKCIL